MRISLLKDIIILVLLVILTGILQSCKTYDIYINPKAVQKDKELFKIIDDQNIKFNTIEIRAKIEADFIERRNPLRVSIRIKKDSLVWVSLNLSTGLPIGKASFTQDSIRILDRVNDKIYIGSYEQLKNRKGISVNYDLLQSILVNNVWNLKDKNVSIIKKEVKENELYNTVFLDAICQDSSIFNLIYIIDKGTYKVEKVSIINSKGLMNVDYSEYEVVNNKLFPKKLELSILNEEKHEEIDIEITKVNIDRNQKYPFKIIKRFEIIEL